MGSASPGWRAQAALAAAAYFAASVLLTWPLLTHLDTALFADFGDARGWASTVWAETSDLVRDRSTLLAAPFGIASPQPISHPITDGLVRVIARAGGEIAAMNLFVLLAFPLTALATFGL